MKSITILGATGSVGLNAIDVIAMHPNLFSIQALTANENVTKLVELCKKTHPKKVVIAKQSLEGELELELKKSCPDTEVLSGHQAIIDIAADDNADIVIAAIVGAAGLPSCIAAAAAGKQILLANKESLVMAGELLKNAVELNGAQLVPIDSEHNAIFQCLGSEYRQSKQMLHRIILTASGGPFRSLTKTELLSVTPEQACHHPNWNMGRKISVDSATMMNKGLEVIEAHYLFDMPANKIEVIVHPQSIVHSMIEYIDGSIVAQMSYPDMKIPIAFGLSWPDRIDTGVSSLDFTQLTNLEFEQPDNERFPCLSLAYSALEKGGVIPTILNAANEIAVHAFLVNQLRFVDIPIVIETILQQDAQVREYDLEILFEVENVTKIKTNELIRRQFRY